MKINWHEVMEEIQLLFIFIIGYNSWKELGEREILSIIRGIFGLIFIFLVIIMRNFSFSDKK